MYLSVHQEAFFGARPDSYGLVAIYGENDSTRLFADVLQLRYQQDGSADFAVPTPVR